MFVNKKQLHQYLSSDLWIDDLINPDDTSKDKYQKIKANIEILKQSQEYKIFKNEQLLYLTTLFDLAMKQENDSLFLETKKDLFRKLKQPSNIFNDREIFTVRFKNTLDDEETCEFLKCFYNMDNTLTSKEIETCNVQEIALSNYEKARVNCFNKFIQLFDKDTLKTYRYTFQKMFIITPQEMSVDYSKSECFPIKSIGTIIKEWCLENKISKFNDLTSEQKKNLLKEQSFFSLSQLFSNIRYGKEEHWISFSENLVDMLMLNDNSVENINKYKKLIKKIYNEDHSTAHEIVTGRISKHVNSMVRMSEVDEAFKWRKDFGAIGIKLKLSIDAYLRLFISSEKNDPVSITINLREMTYEYRDEIECLKDLRSDKIKFILKESSNSSWDNLQYSSLKVEVKNSTINSKDLIEIVSYILNDINESKTTVKSYELPENCQNNMENKIREMELRKLISDTDVQLKQKKKI